MRQLTAFLLLFLCVACGPDSTNLGEAGDPCSPLDQDCSDGLVCALEGGDPDTLLLNWTCAEATAEADYPEVCESHTDCVTGLCWASTKVHNCQGDKCCVVTCEVEYDSCEGFPDHPYCEDISPTDPIGYCAAG